MSDSSAAIDDTVDANVVRSILAPVRGGDFTARMPLESTGMAGKVADGLNDVMIANEVLGAELARVSEVVGKQGKLSQRAVLSGWTQIWSGSIGIGQPLDQRYGAIATHEHTPGIEIALLDIMMPVIDGYETIREIRRRDEFDNPAIIAVTDKAVPGERQRCIDVGVDDNVPKPVDAAKLLAALRPWLPTPTSVTP